MEHDKLIEALMSRAAMVGVSAKDAIMFKEAAAQLAEQAAEVKRWKDLYESMERTWKRTEVKLAEKDKQLAAAVERLDRIDKLCVAFRDTGSSGLEDMFARDVMALSGPQEAWEGGE